MTTLYKFGIQDLDGHPIEARVVAYEGYDGGIGGYGIDCDLLANDPLMPNSLEKALALVVDDLDEAIHIAAQLDTTCGPEADMDLEKHSYLKFRDLAGNLYCR